MSEKQLLTPVKVTVDINGKAYEAQRGQTVIQVADANNVYIPRFCYHEQLSVVANCRMCLIEVENVPKALPACATPVSDGMKVMTQSPKALAAQRTVMSFLLANHPLDCPVCDQGGACELQDLSMGFGRGTSDFTLPKRAVKDLDVGPLIETHMTRCIHCTRCVRFGEEVAGMRELGATGRGEHMEIGTYVASMIRSEMSGNVIDLCPVGALTSKPFALQARHWELRQHPGVALHDAVGSHVYWHSRGDAYHAGRRVMKVIPRYAPDINDNWISDRDRFSYLGLDSPDRLLSPELKIDGQWRRVSWSEAMEHVVSAFSHVVDQHGPGAIGALASPQASTETLYAMQAWLRGLGCHHIDCRVGQQDFADDHMPTPSLTHPDAFNKLRHSDAVLLVGASLRQEQPLLNWRLRQAALHGAYVMSLNMMSYDANHHLAHDAVVSVDTLVPALAHVLQACMGADALPEPVRAYADACPQDHAHRDQLSAIAAVLSQAQQPIMVLGAEAYQHPDASLLRQMLALWSEHSGHAVLHLPMGANMAGACLAGAMHGYDSLQAANDMPGQDALAMVLAPKRAYMLLNMEPEWDHAHPAQALSAIAQADTVVACMAFASDVTRAHATVLLPIAPAPYEDGSMLNVSGAWQRFTALPTVHEDLRQGWDIFRMLADRMSVAGVRLDAVETMGQDLRKRLSSDATSAQTAAPCVAFEWPELTSEQRDGQWQCVVKTHMYQIDPLVRRSQPLQAVAEVQTASVTVSPGTVRQLGLGPDERLSVVLGDESVTMPYVVDEAMDDGVVMLYRQPRLAALHSGAWVTLRRSV